MAKTAQEIVQFMENIEMSEDFDGDAKKKIAQASGEAKIVNDKKATKKNNNTSGQKFCLLHGNNNTHTTDECNTLKAQAKKLKGNTGGNAGKAKGKGKNKTWNNKSKDVTNKSKGELTSMLLTLNSRSSITMTWKNLSSRTPMMERSTMPPSLPKCLSERQARIR